MNVAEFIVELGLNLVSWGQYVWDFVGYEFTVGGSTYAVYELLFGAGIGVVLTYIILTWIGNLIN